MPLPYPNGVTVTIRRRTLAGTDDYGNPTYTTADTTVAGCAVAPRNRGDASDFGRQGVIVGQTLYAPYDTVILAADLVVYNGEEYRIEGDPGYWYHPKTGVGRGVEVALTRAEG